MYKVIFEETEANMTRCRMEDKFKDDFKETTYQSVNWTNVAQGTDL